MEISPEEGRTAFLKRIHIGSARVRAHVTKDGKNVAGVRLLFHSQTDGVQWKLSDSLEQNLDVRTGKDGQYEAILVCDAPYQVASIFVCAHARNLNVYSGIASHRSSTIFFGKKERMIVDWLIVLLFFCGWIGIFLRNGPYMMATFAPVLFLIQFYRNRRLILWEGVRVVDCCGLFIFTMILLSLSAWMQNATPLFLTIFAMFWLRKRIVWWDFWLLWVVTFWCLLQNAWQYRDVLIYFHHHSPEWFVTIMGAIGCFPVGLLGVQTLGMLWSTVNFAKWWIPIFIGMCVIIQGLFWWVIYQNCIQKEKNL